MHKTEILNKILKKSIKKPGMAKMGVSHGHA